MRHEHPRRPAQGSRAARVVSKRRLPPPAASTVYELTPYGEELRPVVHQLAHWGLRSLHPPTEADALHPGWLPAALRTAFPPSPTDACIEFRIGDERATFVGGEVLEGPATDPDVAPRRKIWPSPGPRWSPAAAVRRAVTCAFSSTMIVPCCALRPARAEQADDALALERALECVVLADQALDFAVIGSPRAGVRAEGSPRSRRSAACGSSAPGAGRCPGRWSPRGRSNCSGRWFLAWRRRGSGLVTVLGQRAAEPRPFLFFGLLEHGLLLRGSATHRRAPSQYRTLVRVLIALLVHQPSLAANRRAPPQSPTHARGVARSLAAAPRSPRDRALHPASRARSRAHLAARHHPHPGPLDASARRWRISTAAATTCRAHCTKASPCSTTSRSPSTCSSPRTCSGVC